MPFALSTVVAALGPVRSAVLLFSLTSLATKYLWEKLDLLLRSNLKYRFLNALASYIHYGPDLGVPASLRLDAPSEEVYRRRVAGQEYLHSKLGGTAEKKDNDAARRGTDLAASLVDCRFALAKVCMPLLRELEFPSAGRNFVASVRNGSGSKDGGMLRVTAEDGVERLYVGNDAVQTMSAQSFYAPVQEEINRRMSLQEKNDSMLRFCPIAMNAVLEKNVRLVKQLTGMDKVRYSLSGSEAIDACIKDIKATSGKPLVVRFKSAYHGHTSGISFLDCAGHVFLEEGSQQSIDFIEKYHYRIAAVIVNPMQHFTGINKPSPPGEKVTHGKRVRSAVPRDEHARWLHALSDKIQYCTKYLSRIAFVMDDIYFAFRTPELTSARYFLHPDTKAELRPDVIVLGKALAAGYPLSAVAGREGYLNSYDKKWLLKVNKTVGTFAAWHGGLVASNVFLEALDGSLVDSNGKPVLSIDAKEQIGSLVAKCDSFTARLNAQLAEASLPIRLRNFANTFSVDYLNQSLYNSRYPQYLLAEGIMLGNYSTGKFNLSADVTEADLKLLGNKLVAAATKMNRDGYFEPVKSAAKRRFFLRLLARFAKNYTKIYYDQIMDDKHIDIEVSHNHPVNKFGHFWSSVGMIIFAYPLIFWHRDPLRGCMWFFITHAVRQTGHFFYEHQDRDIEKLKFGHKDASKKEAVAFLLCAGAVYWYRDNLWAYATQYIDASLLSLNLDQYVSVIAFFTIVPHFVEIVYEFGILRGVSWALKILTDPFTDLLDFYTHVVIHPKWFLDFKEQRATYQLDLATKHIIKVD